MHRCKTCVCVKLGHTTITEVRVRTNTTVCLSDALVRDCPFIPICCVRRPQPWGTRSSRKDAYSKHDAPCAPPHCTQEVLIGNIAERRLRPLVPYVQVGRPNTAKGSSKASTYSQSFCLDSQVRVHNCQMTDTKSCVNPRAPAKWVRSFG